MATRNEKRLRSIDAELEEITAVIQDLAWHIDKQRERRAELERERDALREEVGDVHA